MWVPHFTRDVSVDGAIYRALDADRRDRLAAFMAQYRRVRERDGYRVTAASYYRSLPHVLDAEPQSSVWKIRLRSFERLCPLVARAPAGQGPAVLDLGAGNGWLSHRLAALGCRPVAVDLLVDEQDGLGACRHYDLPFVCVEADFDALPLAPGQFDAVIFNGSLHYAPDAAATLDHAHAMLRPGGLLAVVDSPMFARERDGQAMRRRLCDRLREDYDIADPVHPGQGFLTFGGMAAWAARHACRSAFLPSESGWRPWLRRRGLARALGRGRSPEFGVWVST